MLTLISPCRTARRLLLAGVCWCSWCAFAQSAGAPPQDLQEKFRAGIEAMRAGNPQQAELDFRAVTELAPNLAEAHLELGMAEVRTGKLDEAVQSIEKAVQLNPRLPNANLFLAVTYHQMNRIDPALTAVDRELALNPDNADALLWKGILYLAKDDPEQAAAPLDRAAQLAPKDANILDYRGRAHLQVSKESYRALYELDPNSWRVHRLQGEIFADAFQYNDAAKEFEKAIALAPGQADLYESLGRQYQKLNRLELAENAFKKELALNPANAVAMYDLGMVEVEHGNARSGVPLLERVVAESPGVTPAFYYLGKGQADLGQTQAAVSSLEHVIQANPTGEDAERSWYQLGHIYRTLGRTADANHAIQQFAKLKQQIDSEKDKTTQLFVQSQGPQASGVTAGSHPQP